MEKTYKIKAKVWIFPGDPSTNSGQVGVWHMITLPKNTARDIDYYFAHVKRGWGSLPVIVTLGKTTWKTSIFTDKKSDSYILPLKAQVRKLTGIKAGDNISFALEINT